MNRMWTERGRGKAPNRITVKSTEQQAFYKFHWRSCDNATKAFCEHGKSTQTRLPKKKDKRNAKKKSYTAWRSKFEVRITPDCECANVYDVHICRECLCYIVEIVKLEKICTKNSNRHCQVDSIITTYSCVQFAILCLLLRFPRIGKYQQWNLYWYSSNMR